MVTDLLRALVSGHQSATPSPGASEALKRFLSEGPEAPAPDKSRNSVLRTRSTERDAALAHVRRLRIASR